MPLASHSIAFPLRASHARKMVTARAVVRLIQDGYMVAPGGCIGIGCAENTAVALQELFLERESEDADGLSYEAKASLKP